jgi:thiol-disulfide isomerase/thioredoxin
MKMTPRRRFLASLSALLVLSGLSFGLAAAGDKVGKVSMKDLDGKKVAIDFSAAPVTLVNFWAVWCMPCRDEIPDIAKLVTEFGGKGLQVYGIAMESGEAAEVKSFLDSHKEFGVNFPMLMGTDDTGEAFGGVMAVPTTFLVDSRGQVIRKYIGVTSDFHKKVSGEIAKTLDAAAAPPKGASRP